MNRSNYIPILKDLTPTKTAMFYGRVNKLGIDECWPWTARTTAGYGIFIHWLAHRVAYALYHGKDPSLNVCHHCDNPPCCNPAHLFEGTIQDNNRDREEKHRNRPLHGEMNGCAILTEAQVIAIRSRYQPYHVTKATLADEFGVTKATIKDILSRRTWSHLR